MACLTALGRINQTEIGGEFAGVVTRVGGECDLVPGDRVCGIVFDCFKSFARSDAQTLMRIPDELSFIDAAALPMIYTTAHHALVEIGRLLKGEKILIHAAAGGAGQAGVQLAKNIGPGIFVTVGFESKRNLLIDLYGIPKDHMFYSRNTTFAQGVVRMTQNRGCRRCSEFASRRRSQRYLGMHRKLWEVRRNRQKRYQFALQIGHVPVCKEYLI